MTSSVPSSELGFAERYAILELDGGGVLLDLVRGTYSAMNATATAVCVALSTRDEPELAAADVAQRLGIGQRDAARAISEVRRGLELPPPPPVDVGPFRYQRAPEGDSYTLSVAGSVRLEIAADGSELRVPDAPVTTGQLYEYLRAVAPKVLFLRGAIVLHGSACWVGTGLRAICGASGAGKTTTGRAFVNAGLASVSEDLLVLSSVAAPQQAYLHGERNVHAWARETSRRVCEGGPRTIAATGLEASLSGETAALNEIWFIEAGGRRDDPAPSIRPRRLSRTEAAIKLMNAVFLGAAAPASWRRFLGVVETLTAALPLFEVSMPNGLAQLERAARDYTENSAS